MPQTSVSLSPQAAFDGQLDPSAPYTIESCYNEEAGGLPFGRAVVISTAAGYGTQKGVDLVDASGDATAAFGVALRNPTYPADSAEFADGDGVSVLIQGTVVVQVEDAVVANGSVFVRHTAGASLTALGRFRSDDGDEGGGALAGARTGWKYLDSASAGGYARVLVTA